MNLGLLRTEEREGDKVISMIGFRRGKLEVCKIQPTRNGPPKLILTRLAFTHNKNYSTLLYNYEGSFLFLETEIGILTQSGRCFTLEELKKQQKAKGKEVMEGIKDIKVKNH